MDATGLIAIITVSLSGISALIATVFQNSSLSRCTEIDCFCCHCVRDPLDKEEMQQMDQIITHGKKEEVVARPVGK